VSPKALPIRTNLMKMPSKTWQELGDEFHMQMGYCIAHWASVDNGLFKIFHTCVGPLKQSAIIYYKIPGLEARLTLTDEIIRSIFPSTKNEPGKHPHRDVKRWTNIRNNIADLLPIRRRIAHHPVRLLRNRITKNYLDKTSLYGLRSLLAKMKPFVRRTLTFSPWT
jgi:hypothetical protein